MSNTLTTEGIAELLRISRTTALRRANKEGWPFSLVQVNGGSQKQYAFESLPAEIQSAYTFTKAAEIKAHQKLLIDTGYIKYRPEADIEARGFVFHNQPESEKDKAIARAKALKAWRHAQNKLADIPLIAAQFPGVAVDKSSLYRWAEATAHVPEHCWRFYLVTVRKARACSAEFDPCIKQMLISDFLRPSTNLVSCYRRASATAKETGKAIPSIRTVRRLIVRELPVAVKVYCRDGADALEKLYPAMVRDPAQSYAMQEVNIDGHKLDVMCEWADGTVSRPLLLAIQDIYSRKLLGYRLCVTENKGDILLIFGDVFKTYGIPMTVFMDNGRGFVSKWITGGVPHRFRGKNYDSDPLGVLPKLGVDVVFVRPMRGQSKPIERSWLDFAVNNICSQPELEGATTGPSTQDKPHNYGSRVVKEAVLRAVVERCFIEHNARVGRRTKTAAGSSFNLTFNASYANAQIRKIPQADLVLFTLAVESKTLDARSGAVRDLFGNTYWHEALTEYAGESVIVRFDPTELHQSVHVYTKQNVLICQADCTGAFGYRDQEAARTHAAKRNAFTKAAKGLARATKTLTEHEVAAKLPHTVLPEIPAAKVIAPNFKKPVSLPPDEQPSQLAQVFDLAFRRMQGQQ